MAGRTKAEQVKRIWCLIANSDYYMVLEGGNKNIAHRDKI